MTVNFQITESSRVIAVSDQVSSSLADEIVILNLKSNVYHGLNAVGAYVWEFIQEEPKTIQEIQNAVLAEYEVDTETCKQDLHSLLIELAKNQLIEIIENG